MGLVIYSCKSQRIFPNNYNQMQKFKGIDSNRNNVIRFLMRRKLLIPITATLKNTQNSVISLICLMIFQFICCNNFDYLMKAFGTLFRLEVILLIIFFCVYRCLSVKSFIDFYSNMPQEPLLSL